VVAEASREPEELTAQPEAPSIAVPEVVAAPEVAAPATVPAEPAAMKLPVAPDVEPPKSIAEVPEQPVMAAAVPQAASPTEASPLASTGLLPLPKCAASSVRWSQRANRTELEVSPVSGGRFSAAFRMKNPERLVIDVNGPSPKRSFTVKAAEIPNVSALRIGKRKNGGTRLVFDLARPAALKIDGARLELTY
jgi:hypothetical protein